MPPPSTPAVPLALPIRAALDGSAPLASLARRMQESQARYATIVEALPPALQAHVAPGPIDAQGWSLLAANAAVAAKLRHLVPRLDESLRAAGWPASAIRVKVLAR